MTSLQPSQTTGNELVQWDGGETGLEDFDTSDLTMPRLGIDHIEGKFKNTQTEELFDSLVVVLLGLHKSRIMWGEVSEGNEADAPLCKSPNTREGFPNMDPQLPEAKQFPWGAQSVYNPGDAIPLQLADGQKSLPSIACKGCHFKEWNTDPSGKRPWCSEEWTFPLLYQDPEDPDTWVPALWTIRRSGIKPARAYVTPFATKKAPIFTVATRLELDANRRGSVKYCTPKFTKVGKTDQAAWQDYFDSFKSAQAFLGQIPTPKDEDDDPAASVPEGDIEGNVVDGSDPWASAPAPAPSATPAATETPAPAPAAPTPPPPPEEPVFSTVGKVKAPQAAGEVIIDDDEEPPF